MLVVFLNNKLITCDTITPLLVELKMRYPDQKIEAYCFDSRTYEAIHRNVVIDESLQRVGKLIMMTDHRRVVRHEAGFQRAWRLIMAGFYLTRLAIIAIVSRPIFVHFKALNSGWMRILFWLNPRRTYLFESTMGGYTEAEIAQQKTIYRLKNNAIKPNATALVHFSEHWHHLRQHYTSEFQRFHITAPAKRACWQSYVADQYLAEIDHLVAEPDGLIVTFILGSMDKIELLDPSTSFVDLFRETLEILNEEAPEFSVVCKPHPATLPKFFELQREAAAVSGHSQVFFSELHPSTLAHRSAFFICNGYSSTLPLARVLGVPTIEYTHHSPAIFAELGSNSTRPDQVDYFIYHDPTRLREAIRICKKSLRREFVFKEEKTDAAYEEVLALLAGRVPSLPLCSPSTTTSIPARS